MKKPNMENAPPQHQPLLLRREEKEEISGQLLTRRGSSFGSSLIADGDIHPINKVNDFFREFSVESKKLWFLAGPAIFTSICQYSLGAISQVFAGQVGTLELAAVSVENSVIAGFSFGVMLGMGSALETLCGQAFGAGQLDMLGVYMQRSWIILDVTALLLTLLYIFAAPLLHLIGQDEKIAEAAGKFAIWMIPQLFAYAMNFPIAKFLQSQSKMMVMAIISCVALVLHTFFSWLLMLKLGWGLVGAAVVLNSSWWFIVVAQLLYIFSGTCGRAWTGFSMKAFENLWGFVRLSIASAVMLCLEVWYFMALILFAGYLKNAEIAVDGLSICVIYADTAKEVWDDLNSRFSQGNAARIFQIKRAICTQLQEQASITAYFTKLKTLWDELASYKTIPDCSCGSSKAIQDYQQQEQVYQFLMGLNDSYAALRSQILAMETLPLLGRVYSLFIQEEKQRELHMVTPHQPDAAALFVSKGNASFEQFKSRTTSTRELKGKNRFKCDHCHKPNHTIDRCYKLHGYPPRQATSAVTPAPTNPASSMNASSTSKTEMSQLTPEQYQQLMALLNLSNSQPSVNFTGPYHETDDWDR